MDSEAEDELEGADGSDLTGDGLAREEIVRVADGTIVSKRDFDSMEEEEEEARALADVGGNLLAKGRKVGLAPPWCGHCQSDVCLGRTIFCRSRRPSS